MFTIQYVAVNGEHKMQKFDSGSRVRLASHLSRFEHPIVAVFEQATPITKTMQRTLRAYSGLSKCAKEFAFATSPASCQ